MIESLPSEQPSVVAFRMSGTLHDEDYQTFVPTVESAIDLYGKVRILAQFVDFKGWDLKALWDDIKFSTKHCNDVERVALVGENTWERWMAGVCKPFTRARVQYFDANEMDSAWMWINEDL